VNILKSDIKDASHILVIKIPTNPIYFCQLDCGDVELHSTFLDN